MRVSWRWGWAGLLWMVQALATAAAPASPPAADAPVWRYGMLANYAPYQLWPEGGWPGGADFDMLQAAAQARGGRLVPVRYTDFQALLADLSAGRLDVASAMARTPERERVLAFGPPYARIEQAMVVRSRDGNAPLAADLGGRRIAVIEGYASASQVARLFPLAERVPVADVESALRVLGEGRADVFIEAAPAITETLDRLRLPDLRVAGAVAIGADELHLAAPPGGQARLAPLTTALEALGEGSRRAALLRWSSAPPLPPADAWRPDAAERRFLDALPPLRVAVVRGQAPFATAGPDGQPVGLSVDTLSAALAHLGLPPPQWRLQSATEALAALREGEADLALGLPEVASRTSGIGFAGPFIEHPLMLVSRRERGLWSLDQLANRRVALPDLQVPATLLQARFPRLQPMLCADIAACLRAVEDGEADAMVADVVSVTLELASGGWDALQLTGTAGDLRHERGVAVSPAQRPLVPLLQRALDHAVVAALPGIKQRWLQRPPPQRLVREVVRRAAPWVAGALALLAMGWWWHSAGLRAEVARTQAARRDAEQAAAAAQRFVAFLAHEVRNSLHSVIAAVELLRGERGVPPAVTEPLGQSARGTLALLNGLLDRERLAAGELTLDPGPVRLSALVQAVVDEMGAAARLAGVTIAVEPLPDRLLRVDALRVQQVLRNLLSNAIKYAGPGTVEIAGGVAPQGAAEGPEVGRCRVTLNVRDHGPGLPPARLAEPFRAWGGAEAGRPDSAGLGLALGRDLARALGGDLQLERAEGGGVLARFEWQADCLEEPRVDPQLRAGGGRRVLLVEDAEVYAMLLQRAMEAGGWTVEHVASVAAARAALAARPFDVLLTDLHLPDGDATAVLEAAVRPGLTAVVMTADLDDAARTRAAGTHLVAKNADVALFVARVRELLPEA